MNLDEHLGDLVEACACHNCLSVPGYIYRLNGTEYRLRYNRITKKIICWLGCPWEIGSYKIEFCELFEVVDDHIKNNLIYHFNLF